MHTERLNMKYKIVVFGTGSYYKEYKEELQAYDIVAFLDNDTEKQRKSMDGITVFAPDECTCLEFDYVFLLSRYDTEMREQLIGIGIPSSKIVMFADFLKRRVWREYKVYTEGTGKAGNHVLIVSNSLSYTGAPIVLMHAARILKEEGYSPVFLSNADGKLRETILDMGIPVIVEKHLETFSCKLQDWIDKFDFIIVNTLLYHRALLNCNLAGKKVLWWLHEGENYYSDIRLNPGYKEVAENLIPAGVGFVACEAFEKMFGIKPRSLVYGINEIPKMEAAGRGDIITFALIGSIIERKGTDIFVDAIKKINPLLRERANFLIVGEYVESEKSFYDDIKTKIAEMQREIPGISVSLSDETDYENMKALYGRIDVVVCPSRVDPMPVVAAEAMSLGKPCIVSDKTGTSGLIKSGVDGIVVNIDDANSLVRAMETVIGSQDQMKRMGRESRKIYEKYFSMSCFKEQFMNLIRELTNQSI